jgi:HK97 family phage major capsid protein
MAAQSFSFNGGQLPAGVVLMTPEDRETMLGVHKEFKAGYEKALGELKTGLGDFSGETKEKLGKLTDAVADMQAKYEEQSKKQAEREKQLNSALALLEVPKSIGEQVVTYEPMVTFGKSGLRGGVVVQAKRPRAQWGSKDITGLSQVMPAPLGVVAVGPRLPFGVRSLCPTGRTTAGAVEYFRETSFTNNAGPVMEGTKKPLSDKTFDPITAVIRTIAHYFKVSQQTWDDLPFLSGLIESNGIYGVQIREDAQLLNGNGVAPQMEGFNHAATLATPPTATDSTLIDAVGAAFFQLAAAGYLPDGTVTNPGDWGAVALMKNSLGNYLFANPLDYSGIARIWGMRLVMSANQVAGTFLTGAFQGNCQIVDRDDINVQISNQNEDDFVKNMYTVLIEERMVLAILQPAAFLKGVVPVVVP